MEAGDLERLDEARPHLRCDDELAVWLAVVGGELGQEFVVGYPGRGSEPGALQDRRPDLGGDPAGPGNALQVLGEVEIGLVEREGFDERGVFLVDLPDLAGNRPVDLEARRHEDEFGTEAKRLHRGHGGADAELPRLVAGGGYDAALARAADGNRPPAQRRIVALLDAGIEGVEVDMADLAD